MPMCTKHSGFRDKILNSIAHFPSLRAHWIACDQGVQALLFLAMSLFQNPILPGFYPDPSICRVGDDYYLLTSSFAYFPGIPIFHSRDLVHWRQIGHCLERREQLDLKCCTIKDGIWAPAICHHRGIFYVTATKMQKGGGGNFIVTATDPAGPWSDPIWVDQPGIDPSLFFDEEDRCHYLTTHRTPGRSRNEIVMSEIDLATGKRLSELVTLWSGIGDLAPEGPHLYKIGGFYYLMIAEGGTYGGHMENIARSESLWGPYVACPHNPILTHRHDHSLPIQFAGHGDLVELPDASWWMVHLGVRCSFYQKQHLGRETFLVPVSWSADGWPLVNGGSGVTDMETEAPKLPPHPWTKENEKNDFGSFGQSYQWNYLGNPAAENYSVEERPGWLRLRGSASTLASMEQPTFLGRRQQHFNVQASVWIDFDPAKENEEAGLAVYMSPDAHYKLSIQRRNGKRIISLGLRLDRLETEIGCHELADGPAMLEILAARDFYGFRFGQGETTTLLGEASTRYLCAEVADTFTGVYFGMFATGNGQEACASAHFQQFDYKPL